MKTDNSSTDKNSKEDKDFLSAEVYYIEAKEIQTYERERKKELETRAGVFLAIIGVLIGLMITNLNFNIWEKGDTVLEKTFLFILQVFNASPLFFILLAFLKFVSVLKTNKYMSVQLDKITEKSLTDPVEKSYKTLFTSYKKSYIHNYHLNENKAKQFQRGVFWLSFSIFYYLAAFILFNIVKEVL